MLIESVSGVRGIFPSDLDDSVARRYAYGFHCLMEDGPVIVGRDTRPSGPRLLSSIIGTFESAGRHVRDCGVCPTPTVQFVVGDTDAVGGIVVTASHNPQEYNGLKFLHGDGCFLTGEQFVSLSQLANRTREVSDGQVGAYSRFDQAVRRHIERILRLNLIDTDAIRQRRFKVAVDTVNGAAGEAVPYLLERLNCETVEINCDLSGRFARGAEPLPHNLKALCEAVRENRCAAGLATDPDGDRLAIVHELGEPLGEEYTLVLAVDDFLRSTGSTATVVTNLSTTQAVDWVARKYGATVARSAVGETNVVELMKKLNSPMGGEGNGGVILRDIHLGRDSLVGTALVLDRMARSHNPLSTIVEEFPRYCMIKDKIPAGRGDPDAILRTVADTFKDVERIEVDGLKLVWPDRWIHIRRSNTEPIIRIYAEAETESEAVKLIDTVKTLIQNEDETREV